MERELPNATGMLWGVLSMEKPKTWADWTGHGETPLRRDDTNAMNVGRALLRAQASFATGESTLGRSPISAACVGKPSVTGQPFFPTRTFTTK